MLCRACFREIPGGSAYCPQCGARQGEGTAPSPAAAPPPSPARNPWENRAGRGAVAAFGETLQRALLDPVRFFRETAPAGNAGRALLYAVIVGTLSLGILFLWQRALAGHLEVTFRDRWREVGGLFPAWSAAGLFAPVAIAIWVLSAAAIFHVSLAVVGAANGPFTATLKAVAYAATGLVVLALPVCGGPVAVVWTAALQVIGFRELHRTSSVRAFLGWVLPAVVAWALIFTAALFFGFGLLRMMQGLGGRFDV